jgi:RNA polymerase sigma-70 factor (ECF subfamily)
MTLAPNTFAELVNTHYEPLYRFAYSLTQGEPDACDLVQETFRQLALKAHQLQDASKAKSWLFTTLYRQHLDHYRRRRRYPHFDLEIVDAELPAISPDAMDRIDAKGALAALEEVDPAFRAPLTLFYLEDHSYQEIAEILGIPIGTVMSRIARGRALLRTLLREKFPQTIPSPP